MTLPNFGIPDQAASEEMLRGAVDANSQALASIIAPIVDYLTSGIAANQKALNRITSALKRQLTRGIQQNAQALGVTSNALQQQIVGGINSAGAMLAPIVAATSGIGAGSVLQPAQGFSSPLPPPPPPPPSNKCIDIQILLSRIGDTCGPQGEFGGNMAIWYKPGTCNYCAFDRFKHPFQEAALMQAGWAPAVQSSTNHFVDCFIPWLNAAGWSQVACPSGGIPPTPPICPDPNNPLCPPTPPTCPDPNNPLCPPTPPTCPDPNNPLCPPEPPPPTTPPTPPPGTSCDAPLYISVCPKPSTTPPDSGCTTDPITQEKTCPPPPPPNPINPIIPTGGLLQCGLTAEGALPPVGSPEWCGCIEALSQQFADIGNAAISFIGLGAGTDASLNTSAFLAMIAGPLGSLPLIGSFIAGLQSGVSSSISLSWSTLSQTISTQLAGGATQLLGMSVARTVINLLRKFRVGTDAAIWATIDIEVTIAPIERIIDYLIDYILPTEIPSIQEAIEAYKYNTASEGLVRCWLMLRGANPSVWLPIINARREKLQARESIELDRRHGQDEVVQVQSLRNLGFTDERDAIARVELYDEIPSIADHLHWLQRNVFDDQYVQDYGLLEGFQERFWAKFGADLRTKGMLEKYAALHYAAHWINPAPGQLLEMVYRLRPGKPGVQNQFTVDDYARILVEQNVSPYFRKRFAEIAYRVPALGYVRDMYRNRIIDDAELRSIHQDIGYSPSDSERFLQIDRLVRTRMRASEGHGWTPGALANAYSIRQIDQLRVRAEMNAQGFTDEESAALMERADADFQRTILSRARSRVLFAALTQIRQAITVGVIDQQGAIAALVQLGWPEQFAVGWAQMQLQGANVALVKQATSRLKAAFFSGEIDLAFAAQSLSVLGVVQERRDTMLLAWQLSLTPNRKRRSASQIVNDLSLGEISREDALLRLTNLGYEDADKRLYIADAQRKLIHREQQILAAEQKTERMHAAAVEKAQKEAERQAKEELQYLKMLSPVSKMQKWAALGLMGRDKFFERMRTFGYDDPDTERYYEEACAKRNAACVEVAPEPPGPPSGNGSSGFP